MRSDAASTEWTLGYRPSLDGLRGLAVLLVVGQHALVPGMARAGTVGVTIFLVLSGFLITTLLQQERHRNGSNDLVAFWGRRARRLFPALVAFVITMAVIGVAGSTLLAVSLYYANWLHVWTHDLVLLKHMWTLSLEEQFYLVWPVAFVLAGGRVRTHVLVAGVAFSIASRIFITTVLEDRTFAFYSSITRMDALLAGCLLAVSFRHSAWRPGLRTIALAVVLLTIPSVIADLDFLLLVGIPMATAGSLIFVAFAATSETRWLSSRSLVYVGTISYGLYLWHGPLVTMGREGDLGVAAMVVLVAASFALAAVSRVVIEQPFLQRRSRAREVAGAPGHF